jgi:hypothetical protein
LSKDQSGLRLLCLIIRSARAFSQEKYLIYFYIWSINGTNVCATACRIIPPLPCATVPVNFVSYGTGWIAFDDQSRCRPQPQPVSQIALFSFKDRVANHEQGR